MGDSHFEKFAGNEMCSLNSQAALCQSRIKSTQQHLETFGVIWSAHQVEIMEERKSISKKSHSLIAPLQTAHLRQVNNCLYLPCSKNNRGLLLQRIYWEWNVFVHHFTTAPLTTSRSLGCIQPTAQDKHIISERHPIKRVAPAVIVTQIPTVLCSCAESSQASICVWKRLIGDGWNSKLISKGQIISLAFCVH